MITDWIDDLCAVWAIEANNFKKARSINMVSDANFPESIDLAELAEHPIALTMIPTMDAQYSAGGAKEAFWTGVTEIHLCPDYAKSRIPQILPWYQLVYVAAGGHVSLNGKVEHFIIPSRPDAVAIAGLKYGEESVHWGIVINWVVKENVNKNSEVIKVAP